MKTRGPRSVAKSRGGGKGGGLHDPRRLRARALDYLLAVMDRELEDRQLGVGVSAAARVLAHAEWQREQELDVRVIQWLGGPEKAAQWLAENRERLEAKLLSPSPLVSSGGEVSAVPVTPGEDREGSHREQEFGMTRQPKSAGNRKRDDNET